MDLFKCTYELSHSGKAYQTPRHVGITRVLRRYIVQGFNYILLEFFFNFIFLTRNGF